jgi:hypothetical protein
MRVQRVPIYYHGEQQETQCLFPYTTQLTLAAKLMKQIATVDEVKFLSQGLGKSGEFGIKNTFETASIRVHNSLINFVNDRTIRTDLVLFDYTHKNNPSGSLGSKYYYGESAWLIQTKTEETYIELSTRFERTQIKQEWSDRVKNWLTKKGSTARTIPAIRYVITLKVFDTPKSFYYIDLHRSSWSLPCGTDEPIELSNVDFSYNEDERKTTGKLLQLRKERINERAIYFRNKK